MFSSYFSCASVLPLWQVRAIHPLRDYFFYWLEIGYLLLLLTELFIAVLL